MALARIIFGMFVAIAAMYVTFQLTAAALGVSIAIPLAGIAFAVTAITLDLAWR
jgi:hypothetical protein